MEKVIKHVKYNQEAIIWSLGLAALALMDPTQQHVSICPLSLMDLDFCPGCGLGHSVAYLFRGDLRHSFEAHPLGVFAMVMLLYRIIHLTIRNYKLK